MKTFASGIFSLLFLTASVFASDSVVPAENTVHEFYDYRMQHVIEGAPHAAQLATLRQWFSPRLCAQLEKAGKERQDFIKKHGEAEKPPWCEGDLFSSVFEGPSSYEITGGLCEKDRALVQVLFSHREAHAQTYRWADRVQLKWMGGKWLIDDILYDLPLEFGNKGSLHSNLP